MHSGRNQSGLQPGELPQKRAPVGNAKFNFSLCLCSFGSRGSISSQLFCSRSASSASIVRPAWARMIEASTPLMRQYQSIKKRYPHALLLFRVGDFYELFYEDAIVASRELQITLTSRSRERGEAIPMCGVPFHAAENYIARLLRAGYKIAVCDQM